MKSDFSDRNRNKIGAAIIVLCEDNRIAEERRSRMKVFRQGDVLVRQVRHRTLTGKDVREGGRIMLAHGEVTGHAHEVLEERCLDFDTPAAQFGEMNSWREGRGSGWPRRRRRQEIRAEMNYAR